MQASTYAIKASVCFDARNRRRACVLAAGFANTRSVALNCNFTSNNSICMRDMGMKLTRATQGVETLFRSTVKPRSVKAQASGSVSLFFFFCQNFFNCQLRLIIIVLGLF